jgi:uncharacterized protein (TIGR03118 family)
MSRNRKRSSRTVVGLGAVLLAGAASVTPAAAQYRLVNLVANEKDLGHGIPQAARIDSRLADGWGLAHQPKGPLWVTDELSGYATEYMPDGQSKSSMVSVPTSSADPLPPGCPTGIVANSYGGFTISQNGHSASAEFILVTLDGTIQGWSPRVNGTSFVTVIDNGSQPAVYTGLDISHDGSGTYIYAANAFANRIEKYDSSFKLVTSFSDTAIPYPVYGVSVAGGNVYVTYAPLPPGKPGAGGLDEFDTNGNLIKTIVSPTPGGPLNAPFTVAIAPANFGQYSNDLLVDNWQSGLIQAFDPSTGNFLGSLSDKNGKPIAIPGIWDMDFGGGTAKNGNTNELYFVAGPDTFLGGMMGKIVVDD